MVVAKKRENFEHIFVLNWAPERTQRTNSRWQQKNYFTRFLNNFNIIVTYSKLYCSSNQLLSATKPSIRELEEIKSREFSADTGFMAFTSWFLAERQFTKKSRRLTPGTWLFGSSWRKIIKAFWLHEIFQVSLFLLKGGAQIVNPKTVWNVTGIDTLLARHWKQCIHWNRVMSSPIVMKFCRYFKVCILLLKSSNVNEVIWAVLNFFLRKYFTHKHTHTHTCSVTSLCFCLVVSLCLHARNLFVKKSLKLL